MHGSELRTIGQPETRLPRSYDLIRNELGTLVVQFCDFGIFCELYGMLGPWTELASMSGAANRKGDSRDLKT
jgi:hypothetical protein